MTFFIDCLLCPASGVGTARQSAAGKTVHQEPEKSKGRQGAAANAKGSPGNRGCLDWRSLQTTTILESLLDI